MVFNRKEYEQIPEVKERRRIQKKEYYLKNKERISKVEKEYRLNNKEKISKRTKEYYQKNKNIINFKARELSKLPTQKEKKRILHNLYMKKPGVKENIKKRMQEYGQRPEIRQRERLIYNEKYKNNNKFRTKVNLKRMLLNSFKRYSTTGKIYSSKEYEIDFTAIIEHLKPFPKEIKNYHIDHIIPLSRFNFNNPKHIKIAFAPENHQWLTIEENLSKGNKLIMPHTYN